MVQNEPELAFTVLILENSLEITNVNIIYLPEWSFHGIQNQSVKTVTWNIFLYIDSIETHFVRNTKINREGSLPAFTICIFRDIEMTLRFYIFFFFFKIDSRSSYYRLWNLYLCRRQSGVEQKIRCRLRNLRSFRHLWKYKTLKIEKTLGFPLYQSINENCFIVSELKERPSRYLGSGTAFEFPFQSKYYRHIVSHSKSYDFCRPHFYTRRFFLKNNDFSNRHGSKAGKSIRWKIDYETIDLRSMLIHASMQV